MSPLLTHRHSASPFALAAVMLAVLSCGAPTGDPVGFQPPGPIHKVTIYPADVDWRDTCYDVFVPTGRHYRLAVGSWGGYRSRILLHFAVGDIPKEIPIANITSVTLALPYLRVSGSVNDDVYSYGDVTVTAHGLRRRFDEDLATWWRATFKNNWAQEGGDFGPAVASAVIGDPTYQQELIRMDITGLALEWLGSPHRNYGLLLKAADEASYPGFKEFYSSNEHTEGKAPRLEIQYIDDEGEKAYRTLIPDMDCFITESDNFFGGDEVHGHDAYLDFGSFNGYGRRMLFYFDLTPGASDIPADASIARARLRLFYLPAGRDETVEVAVFRLLAKFNENADQDTLEMQPFHDDLAYGHKEFKEEAPGYVDIYLNTLVQEWVSKEHPNYGLIIKAPDESLAQVFPRFGAQENADSGRRPYLVVEYTVPEEPWYKKPH